MASSLKSIARFGSPQRSTRQRGFMQTLPMFFSILGVLLITLVVFLVVWAIGRVTLGR